MVVVVALDVEDDDDEMARFDRLEFTHVAPVDVNGCGCLIGADDEMERVEIVEGFFRAAWFVERGLFRESDGTSTYDDSKEKKNDGWSPLRKRYPLEDSFHCLPLRRVVLLDTDSSSGWFALKNIEKFRYHWFVVEVPYFSAGFSSIHLHIRNWPPLPMIWFYSMKEEDSSVRIRNCSAKPWSIDRHVWSNHRYP